MTRVPAKGWITNTIMPTRPIMDMGRGMGIITMATTTATAITTTNSRRVGQHG